MSRSNQGLFSFAFESILLIERRDIIMEGLQKLLENPMETLYSLAFLFAFIMIIIKYFLKGEDDDDKK